MDTTTADFDTWDTTVIDSCASMGSFVNAVVKNDKCRNYRSTFKGLRLEMQLKYYS